MTAYGGSILGPIAKFFGIIIDFLYKLFEGIFGEGNVNIVLIIIVFTIVVYTILSPLTYMQQKFSALQRKIRPELKEIEKKYKNKKDQASMLKRQEETQALYDKYGISMGGSCIQLIVQLPILYALFGVFNNLPAYITSVKSIFTDLVSNVQADPDYIDKMQKIYEEVGSARTRVNFLAEDATDTQLGNYVIDVVYKFSEKGWDLMREVFPGFTDVITTAQDKLHNINYLFKLNISDTPLNTITSGWEVKDYAIIAMALCIPVLSYITNRISFAIIQGNNKNDTSDDPMAAQMKTMNTMMPLISLVFVFSVPIGLGIYWIASAVVRTVISWICNKHFEKMDLDKIIEKNKEKAVIKKKKRDKRNEAIYAQARVSTKSMTDRAKIGAENSAKLDKKREDATRAKAGSLTSKANLVSNYNKKNNRDD